MGALGRCGAVDWDRPVAAATRAFICSSLDIAEPAAGGAGLGLEDEGAGGAGEGDADTRFSAMSLSRTA